MTFTDRLRAAQGEVQTSLCVGLDPDPGKLPHAYRATPPAEAIDAFCRRIVDATHDLCCAYKLNMAFFEALGHAGWQAMESVLAHIPDDRLTILDGKRGDIGNTARRYAKALYQTLGTDACTVNPYMGRDALVPFLQDEGRCAFTLVATSNPGGDDLQYLQVEGAPLYRHVAQFAHETAQAEAGEIGFVVGATRPEILADLRAAYPEVPFLIPGVGAQGGTAREVLGAAGSGPVLVNVGRQILYASSDTDYTKAARAEAQTLAQALAV